MTNSSAWPRLSELPAVRMVCFGTGNGSGSKLFQGFLDGHPQVLMIPGYQLMYLYPHWHQWRSDLGENWSWSAAVDLLCLKHAALLDSRRIPASDGLTTLGPNQDQFIQIDEALFRRYLLHLLDGRPMEPGIFLVAVHWAYAFARGEDLSKKRVLVYHLHVHEYIAMLAADFPDMLSLVLVRDPRSNLTGRFWSTVRLDQERLDATDGVVYMRRFFLCNVWNYMVDSLERLRGLDLATVRAIRHEDMVFDLDRLMWSTAQFLGIEDDPVLRTCTFGGLLWWGDKIYGKRLSNKPNASVASTQWIDKIDSVDRAVLDGVFQGYIAKYGYVPVADPETVRDRWRFMVAAFKPMSYEREVLRKYLTAATWSGFLRSAWDEGVGRRELIDYGFNAYYRHKWYNQGLELHRRRWYKRFVLAAQRLARRHWVLRPLLPAAAVVYVAVNLLRYVGSVCAMPVLIIRRALIAITFFRQNLEGTAILPDNVMADFQRIEAPEKAI
ncbi:protein of unknown function (P-loop containing nucleoside triphosphate hydrolyses 6-329) [Magnetospirillum sp. XM-1]|uniref:sulfotransferase n=1 Tax=Magnetospirillum sp. XM-1 TaxID=1663591 RepID=UPI00073DE987|nr:sulfotransferase [Magnetospirillum sp. XM-1]CUW38018.1 protein of unknown function (P-loop containing nucleoside triphosphate hydrolyses 6-329) [Magnetospirillum sp. XM-1]